MFYLQYTYVNLKGFSIDVVKAVDIFQTPNVKLYRYPTGTWLVYQSQYNTHMSLALESIKLLQLVAIDHTGIPVMLPLVISSQLQLRKEELVA